LAVIRSNAYGKTNIRLTYVDRKHRPHDVRELSLDILFEGEFASAYSEGNNANVLPTDTIKNTVYVLARQLRWDSAEALAHGLAQHFLDLLPHLSQVSIDIEEVPWQQIAGHDAAFVQSGNERRTTRLRATRSGTDLSCGIKGLQILKTADSGFAGFLKDDLTTLPETDDRLFGTVLQAEWQYQGTDIQFNDCHSKVRSVLLDCFAQHRSLSVQHTLFAMGKTVLDKLGFVAEIHLIMPNKHCLLVDLSRFGLDNPNQIFVPVDEPSGYIEARIAR
jgi:urate oxidase